MTAGTLKKRPGAFVRILPLPEYQSALAALRDLADFARSDCSQPPFNPLLLHGPPGSGKTCLVQGLTQEAQSVPGLKVLHLSSRDLRPQPARSGKKSAAAPDFLQPLLQDAPTADLFILEDLHHLTPLAFESLVQLIDRRRAEGAPTVFTALVGPRRLDHRGTKVPNRLASRLAGGLVIALEPLSPASRKTFLGEMAQRRQLALPSPVLDWLAEHLTGSPRQLEGALLQLETLCRLGKRLDVKLAANHFGPQFDALRPTVERIVQQVGGYFRVSPGDLQSAQRARSILLPRQVSMYLARQLTDLSLEQIGAYFGGRDHSTVLHACRKVETAMRTDDMLSGAVKDLRAGLT